MFGKVIDVSVDIRPKVSFAMLVTLLGIMSDTSRVSKNACWPIEVTLLGMVMAVMPVTLLNAAKPIDVRLDGRFTEVKDVAPRKAFAPMEVTPDGTFAVPAQVPPLETTPFRTVKFPEREQE